jgi:hypothetical protein
MSGVLDPLTFPTLGVPAIWCPQKEKLLGNPLALRIEEQAKGSLLLSADLVESILRLLYGETEIERVYDPPKGYNPELQGEWDGSQLTFAFRRQVKKVREVRDDQSLGMDYQIEGCGRFRVEITPDSFSIAGES